LIFGHVQAHVIVCFGRVRAMLLFIMMIGIISTIMLGRFGIVRDYMMG
jgi:hypothetical protein